MSLKQNDEYWEQQRELAQEQPAPGHRYRIVKCPRCGGRGSNWLEGYGWYGCEACGEGGLLREEIRNEDR